MAKNTQSENGVINIIGVGTKITGDIETNGDIRIDGVLIGNLNTKGKVVVGESGEIEGKIFCNNSDISGTVKGEITVNEILSLKATAKFFGKIITKKLAIEPNAIFTGTCDMGNNPVEKNQNKKD